MGFFETIFDSIASIGDTVVTAFKEVGSAALAEVGRVTDDILRGNFLDAAEKVMEGIGRIVVAIDRHSGAILGEFARVTGLEVSVGTLSQAFQEAGRFIVDTFKGETEIPMAKLIPIIGCVIAAGVCIFQGNIPGAVRFGAFALKGIYDLMSDSTYHQEFEGYSFPDVLHDMKFAPDERPFDMDNLQRRFEEEFGRVTLREHAEQMHQDNEAWTFDDMASAIEHIAENSEGELI